MVHALPQGSCRAMTAHNHRSQCSQVDDGTPTTTSSRSCWQLLANQGGAHRPQMDGTQGALPACIASALRQSNLCRIVGLLLCHLCRSASICRSTCSGFAGCQQMLPVCRILALLLMRAAHAVPVCCCVCVQIQAMCSGVAQVQAAARRRPLTSRPSMSSGPPTPAQWQHVQQTHSGRWCSNRRQLSWSSTSRSTCNGT